MNKYRLTRVWEIDLKLVVADTIEDAIATYKLYMGPDYHNDPTMIRGIHSDSCLISQMDFSAIIKEDK